jgi:two-component system sensor histidine kinase BaeS
VVVVLFSGLLCIGWAITARRPAVNELLHYARFRVHELVVGAELADRQGRLGPFLRSAAYPEGTDVTLWMPDPVAIRGNLLQVDAGRLARAHRGEKVLSWLRFEPRALLLVPFRSGSSWQVIGLSIPARLPPQLQALVQQGLLLSLALAAGLSLLAGWLLARALTRPLDQLRLAADRLGQGELDCRVAAPGLDEFGQLARTFNQMAERLERLEARQRQLLADVSHNLRTPLSAVLGWTEALQDGLAGPEVLEKIHQQTLYCSRSVHRLVEMSRWQLAEPEFRVVKLRDPLLAVLESLDAHDRILHLHGPWDSVEVRAEPERVRELLQILLENCLQHAGPGASVWVEVREDGRRLSVTVRDDGAGFDPGAPGSGIGLDFARRVAATHGATLDLTSAPGQGTIARFSLPLP